VTDDMTKNLAASVHQRLLNEARASERPFNELLQHYAMERFIYRLSISKYSGNFVLKGALMFLAWKAPVWRPTRDIDLLGHMENEIDILTATTADICRQNVEDDGLRFDPNSIRGERIIETGEYEGVRINFKGTLGKARIPMRLDIGFGDLVHPSITTIEYPTILDFPVPIIRAYSRESVVAEKIEAMVKLGILNSRMKDFFDVWFFSQNYDFAGIDLSRAILKTFKNRDTEIPASMRAILEPIASEQLKSV